MTSFDQRRCVHCGRRYAFQASGGGCFEETNDDAYCKSCKRVILDALKEVPQKTERDYRYTRDVTVAFLVNLEEKREAELRAEGKLPWRRCAMPLFNLRDPSDSNRTGYVRHDGRTYLYSYWSKKGMDAGTVRVEVEVDLETGEVTGPWSLTDRWQTRPTFYEPEPEPEDDEPLPQPSIALSALKMPRFDLVERSQTLEGARMSAEDERKFVLSLGDVHKGFTNGPLPEGSLPVYDELYLSYANEAEREADIVTREDED